MTGEMETIYPDAPTEKLAMSAVGTHPDSDYEGVKEQINRLREEVENTLGDEDVTIDYRIEVFRDE